MYQQMMMMDMDPEDARAAMESLELEKLPEGDFFNDFSPEDFDDDYLD